MASLSASPHTEETDVVVVGPMPPFRGGIAQYNAMLMGVLGKAARCFSFKRQYPKLLYPGGSDRDPRYPEGYREPGVEYVIDSISPWSWHRSAAKIASLKPRLVVFHWWTFFLAPCFCTMMSLLRRRGIRTAIIVHNLSDHDGNAIKARLSRMVLDRADAFLAHSKEHAGILRGLYPGRPVAWHCIPVYEQHPAATNSLPKRGALELLFFGFIRPYKGLDILLDAMRMLADRPIHLTVVGEAWGDPSRIRDACRGLDNVELHLRYSSDEEAAEFFARADAVVLPYRSASGSAVAALAFHYGKPVIATAVGGLSDVVENGVNGALVPPADAKALADAIVAMDRPGAARLADGAMAFKRSNTWQSLADAMVRLAPGGA